jgi:tetratricopeptide (TPR) repeat protein
MHAHVRLAQANSEAATARSAVAAWAAASLARPAPVGRPARARAGLAPPPPPHDDATTTADTLRLKGNEAFASGDWEAAAALYASSLALSPTAPAAANHSAACLRCGDPTAALASADTALALRPDWAKAHARRAAALAACGDDVGAFLAWDVAVRCEPGEPGWATGRQAALGAAGAVRGWRVPGVGQSEEAGRLVPVVVVGEGECA